MNFTSDNVAGVSPEILAALAAVNQGAEPSYGADSTTERVRQRLAELFEHDVTVFPVMTGTAANALALATVMLPWGVVYCHEKAHIANDECGAPEFYTGGARVHRINSEDGKITAAQLAALLPGSKGFVHAMQPAAISLTQATEAGTIYLPEEIAAIGEVARTHELPLHMDGARFANALVSLDATPAEITWKAGVDVLSFGATKNGAMAAEALIFFDGKHGDEFAFRRKRGGHLLSKMRFLSAQLEAYLTDDLWLKNASHANAMASRLADGLAGLPGVRLRHEVEANEVFVEMPQTLIGHLQERGFKFYQWDAKCIRLVTAFNTLPANVDAFIATSRAFIRPNS
jgi:threonine aldolase